MRRAGRVARAVRAVRAVAVLTALVTAVLGVVTGGSPSAGAHTGKQSYVYLDFLADRVEGRVEYLVRDLNEVLDLGIVDDEERALTQLEEGRAVIEAYTRDHFGLELAGSPPPLTFEEFEYLELSVGSYVVQHFTTGPLGGEPPRAFTVRYDAFFDELPDRTALLLIGRDWEGGVIANEAEHLRVFDPDNRSFDLTLGTGSWWRGMSSTISLGTEHIRTGADHVMFIFALLLPSVLVFRQSRWRPTARFRSSLLRVLKVATAFTVAHTITLSLAALDVLNINAKLVESIIAVSIILAALHNLRPLFANREWLIAFGFGLFHGLGFAGLLDELGLARDRTLWTLLGFNLGVEVGQAAIIVLVFPTLYLLRRTRVYPAILVVGSVGLALAALGWAVERVFELRPRIDALFDPLLYYPRVLVLLALAAIVAGAIHLAEKHRRKLVAVAE